MSVQNKSSQPLQVFVSKYNSGGSEAWYTLNSQQSDSWNRESEGWELVAFRVGSSLSPTSKENRAGVYARLGSTVQFYDVTNIQIIGWTRTWSVVAEGFGLIAGRACVFWFMKCISWMNGSCFRVVTLRSVTVSIHRKNGFCQIPDITVTLNLNRLRTA